MCSDDFIMCQHLLLVFTSPLYFTLVGDATMALRKAGSVLEVFLWSVAVVLGQDGWSVTYTTQSICTLRGSTVDLTCSYTYPSGTVTKTLWFTEWGTGVEPKYLGQDPEYAGRLEYHWDKEKDCTLRITDLRERDSATYRFGLLTDQEGGTYTGKLGVTLSVTGLQVKVTGGHQDKTLTCITTCTLTDNPTYIWYKNGQYLNKPTSRQYSVKMYYSDSYSCAVKGHEDHHSPAVCVVGESCMNVTYTHQSICALKGSTVDISCFYTHPSWHNVTEVSWFNKWKSGVTNGLRQDSEYADRVEYHRQTEKDSTLRITDLRESDSTEYKFRFTTEMSRWGHSFPGTTLSFTGLQVKVIRVAEGQRTLTCITTCTLTDNPTYIWYKNGQRLDEPTSQQYSSNTLVVLGHSVDSYSCTVEHHEDLHSPAVYAPKNTSVSVSQSGEIVEGSSVTLTCSSDANPPVDKYTWYKKNVTSPKASGQSYSITNIISEDRGEYYCETQNGRGSMNSTALMIIVAGE
ncbi:B-cell receptor CD22-like [Salvelinus alpinus]|uniref:B-cell receptor CD22-like n=1 Tax=Salvelinus alpinus TaxID=8036 RepID=UPI0039FCB8D3